MITRKRCKFCQHENREALEERMANMQISPDVLDKENNWPSGTTSRHLRNHTAEYDDKSNPRCVLCTDPLRKEYEVGVNGGDLSPSALAEALGTTPKQVQTHMKKHLQPLVQKSAANIIAAKEVNEIDLLSVNVERLNEKIDELFQDDDLTPKHIDSLTKLAKEIRESLKYLLEFKGKLIHKRQDTIVIAQMQVVQEVLAQQHPQVWLDIKDKMQERLQ
jgi:hypothetical protein